MNSLRMFRISIFIICISLIFPLIAMAADAQSGGSLTRGSRFTVTITGQPNTVYYVWATGTFSMSGAPGDQPPVISGGTLNLQKDPPDGPFTIGNHVVSRGGTILDDVAPSYGDFSNTNYYALITTNGDGQALVELRTSSNTATRHFSFRVEDEGGNPGILQAEASLFSRTVPQTPVIITTTAIPTPVLPTSTPTPSSTPEVTMTITTPPTTPVEPTASPTTSSPLPAWIAIGATASAFVIAGKR